MKENFTKALGLVLVHEGGYSNHPKDPGGATMRGVTQRVYDSYRRRRGLNTQSVRYISSTELQEIYKKQYWDSINGDKLPAGLDYAVFDYSVNSGPGRAIKDLQRALGIKPDGHIGQSTAEAIEKQTPSVVINRLCDIRMAFLKNLKTFSTFGKGWTSRVSGVRKEALKMTKSVPLVEPSVPVEPEAPEVPVEAPGKADEVDTKVTAKDGFFEKIMAGIGTAGAGVAAILQGIDWRVGIAIVVVAAAVGTGYLIFSKSKDA